MSNLTTTAAGTVQRCGGKLWNCPPGTKTGDAISAPGGHVGSGRQLQVGMGPAGDVSVNNNAQYPAAPAVERGGLRRCTFTEGRLARVIYQSN